jgi:hypothetical protein
MEVFDAQADSQWFHSPSTNMDELWARDAIVL